MARRLRSSDLRVRGFRPAGHCWRAARTSSHGTTRPEAREAAQRAGLAIQNLDEADWSKIAALGVSPGIPLTHPAPHPLVAKAQQARTEVIGDVELFFRAVGRDEAAVGAKIVCVTGTNGKSTTTALIGHRVVAARLRDGSRRQYRQALARTRAAGGGPCLCFGTVVVSARSDAVGSSGRGRADQCHARSSRSPWHDRDIMRQSRRTSSAINRAATLR